MTAMAPQFAYIMNRKFQPDSDGTHSIRHGYIFYMKSRLHDGTVTEDADKYRLVRIPPSGREPPDVGLTRIRKTPRTQPS